MIVIKLRADHICLYDASNGRLTTDLGLDRALTVDLIDSGVRSGRLIQEHHLV